MNFKDITEFFRVKQWYKNLLIFIAIFFSGNLFDVSLLIRISLGFGSLVLISSSSYIVNDILDYKKDALNPQKKRRPIAAGKINIYYAFFISIILLIAGLYIGYKLNLYFSLTGLALYISTLIYSLYFKNVLFADLLFIAQNFVLRALSGVFLIESFISSWFLMMIFFLAFFLVAGKRYGDILSLPKNSQSYKPVLKLYNKELLDSMLSIFLGALLLIYGLYAYDTQRLVLYFAYPFYVYVLLRYFYLIKTNFPSIRDPENFILKDRDYPLLIGCLLFTIAIFLIYYGGGFR
jgi:4-hydroxybenzoate polyprenyltransferase